jgi:hypothetical protein
MEKEEERTESGAEKSGEISICISGQCMPPNIEKMTPEEKKAYLDDLFFSDLFQDG